MDGPPLVSEHTEASASLPEQRGAADAYRPRYEATSVHLDNTLEDYRREIQRRVFG